MIKNPVDELRAEYAGLIDFLLLDRTTDANIIWATAERPRAQISPSELDLIEPRFMKGKDRRFKRTKNRAEVFTPPDVCKIQNDLIVEPWIDQPDAFIDAAFLEIACGEAPYLVSRYNVVDGSTIELDDRIGLLDRKLKLINELDVDQNDWQQKARRAYQSIYGYEFQGDNLLIARINLLLSAAEYHRAKFNRPPTSDFMRELATVISWNLWQCDGRTLTVPFQEVVVQRALNGFGDDSSSKREPLPCRIMDWKNGKTIELPLLKLRR